MDSLGPGKGNETICRGPEIKIFYQGPFFQYVVLPTYFTSVCVFDLGAKYVSISNLVLKI